MPKPKTPRGPKVYWQNEPPSGEAPPANAPRAVARAEFAKRLSHHMVKHGLNQSELARRATAMMPAEYQKARKEMGRSPGLSRDNISNYVRGRALPAPRYLAVLAKALGTTPKDLLPVRGVPSIGKKTPKLDLRATEGGMTFLTINMEVPTALAVEVYSKLQAYSQGET